MSSMQHSKRNMYLTLRTFLLSNPAITNTLLNVPEFMSESDTTILQIQKKTEHQAYYSIYISSNKKQKIDDAYKQSITDKSDRLTYVKE